MCCLRFSAASARSSYTCSMFHFAAVGSSMIPPPQPLLVIAAPPQAVAAGVGWSQLSQNPGGRGCVCLRLSLLESWQMLVMSWVYL